MIGVLALLLDTGGSATGGVAVDLGRGKKKRQKPLGLERIESHKLSPSFGIPDYELKKLDALKPLKSVNQFHHEDALALVMILSELE